MAGELQVLPELLVAVPLRGHGSYAPLALTTVAPRPRRTM
jgi:hypothetical protein